MYLAGSALGLLTAIAWRYGTSGVCYQRGFSTFISAKSM